ncbi:MAG: LysR family transcriptional regulator [Proteobacteria bacterium]|nr:LysR family transcriptional regulator [Pseudomonadota bacterium]
MDIRQLRNFLAVVSFQSFSRAAESIGKSQQALSKSVQALENELGVPLLIRSAKTVKLTASGKLLAASAHIIDLTMLNLQQELQAGNTHRRRERVRVGVSPTACGLMSEAMLALRSAGHNLHFDVTTGVYESLSRLMLSGALDLFVCVATHDNIDTSLMQQVLSFHDEYRVIAGSTHPLANSTGVTTHQLAEYDWILGHNLGSISKAWRREFELARIPPPDPVMETNSVWIMRSTLIASDLLTILPVHIVEFELEKRVLTCIETVGFSWTLPIAIHYRTGGVLTPGIIATVESLEQASKKYSRGTPGA